MYEQPELIYAGEAEDLILGSVAIGGDLDGTLLVPDFEFLEDSFVEGSF